MTVASVVEKTEHDSPGVNLIPPKVFFACLILGGILELLFPHAFPLLTRPVRIALGLGIGAAGFALMSIAHGKFKRIGTNISTNQPAITFVVQGAYRLSRNPMYVGGSAFFLGMG